MAPNPPKAAGAGTGKSKQSNGKTVGLPKGLREAPPVSQVQKSKAKADEFPDDETSVELELEESESELPASDVDDSPSASPPRSNEKTAARAQLAGRQPKQQQGQGHRAAPGQSQAGQSRRKSRSRSRSQRLPPRSKKSQGTAKSRAAVSQGSKSMSRSRSESDPNLERKRGHRSSRSPPRRRSPQRIWCITANDGRQWFNEKNRPGANTFSSTERRADQEDSYRDRRREPLRLYEGQGARSASPRHAYGDRKGCLDYPVAGSSRDRSGRDFYDDDRDGRGRGGEKGKGKGKGKEKGKSAGNSREEERQKGGRRGSGEPRRRRRDSQGRAKGGAPTEGTSESRVFVKCLPPSMNEENFSSLFTSFGEVLGVKVMVRRSNTCGFVRFSTSLAAQAAVAAMDKKSLEGSRRPLEVKLANMNKKWEAPAAAA